MKKLFCLSFLLLSFTGFTQNPVSFVLGKTNRPFSSNVSVLGLKDFSFAVNLSDRRSYTDKYFFTVYNPITHMNDNYLKVSDQYYQTNHHSFPIYNFNGMKTDSYNPNGVTDIESGILSGLINLFLEKF